MSAMIEHLQYYAEQIETARMTGRKVDWVAREFCRDYGSQLTLLELLEHRLLKTFVTPEDFGRARLNSFTRYHGTP